MEKVIQTSEQALKNTLKYNISKKHFISNENNTSVEKKCAISMVDPTARKYHKCYNDHQK